MTTKAKTQRAAQFILLVLQEFAAGRGAVLVLLHVYEFSKLLRGTVKLSDENKGRKLRCGCWREMTCTGVDTP